MADNPFYHYPLGFKNNIAFFNALSMCSPKRKSYKYFLTVRSNYSADRVKKKETASRLHFELYSSLLQCSICVQSKNGVDLVDISNFYKKMHTVWWIKITTVVFLYVCMHTLSWPPSLQTFL